jgi:hypothetical protein
MGSYTRGLSAKIDEVLEIIKKPALERAFCWYVLTPTIVVLAAPLGGRFGTVRSCGLL